MRSAVALLVIAGISLIALAGFALSGGSGAHAQSTITIQVGDIWFCDSSFQNGVCETTVNAGDTVEWQWVGSASHTTTECAGDLVFCPQPHLWDSPARTSGTFSFTFDSPGSFLYRCQIHPFTMSGAITVLATEPTATPAPTPTPQLSPEPSPQPTPQPSPQVLSEESTSSAGPAPVDVQPAAVPAGGGEPPSDGGASALWWLTLAAGGVLLVATAGLALRRLRR